MEGDDASVFGCPSAAPSRAPPAVRSEVQYAKYTYTPLNALKPKTVVNVYGVVTFFKPPFPSKGSDYSSMIKITDQSDAKVCCNIFAKNMDDHPVILKVGDIIRLHRFKTELYNDSMMLITCRGWSAVTFDGIIDSPVVPRSTSKSFHFVESEKRRVQELRQWAADQSVLSNDLTVPLSVVKPCMYFNLTCQLLAKAVMDSRCVLLKVWDGTKCQHPLLNVAVPPDSVEGESTVAKDRMNLTANVLVYDNHIEVARSLKPGMFLRIFNLHALSQRAPDEQSNQTEQLTFHLHGGTVYGRGLRNIPQDSQELPPLKRQLENHVDLEDDDEVNDDTLLEMWYTPPESVVMRNDEEPDGEADVETSFTVRTCQHTSQRVTLAQVKRSTPPLVCHVRAQVKTYHPQQLYQCLKLFCSKCKIMREVPDDNTIAELFCESARGYQPCHETWAARSSASLSKQGRNISMYISIDMVGDDTQSQLIFVQGMTLNEVCMLSRDHKNLVPVRSDNGRMNLIDLTAPFLFCRDKRYYGCKECSLNTFENPVFTGVETWDEHTVAEALGVQLMEYRLLMEFKLEDHTDTLEALLWERNAERFFSVSAVDASAKQDVQERIQTIMDTLQPQGSNIEERPWLDLCLSVYTVKDNGRNKVCYQITDAEVREVN
ncbi:protection of telomeres protein 1 isoform X1 [Triplophysa rosa]|uniref:protection of telomeres protein 1 isoform X1 n=1 Tax=Triplophysa rosa TaxID=992332 RepID=UPI0025463627|nr:protection of telomeres protein 1 isoform X1 [Triplophysa rosa]XP_057186209.1 protection of telomeres protein 1 isoform X1 [Triplophysa rosa]XP_057186210.1 protection of telomeres protein 1 isoform X1 [Triplophysa rosa]XP_057186212.1 protection of telomeres protein 1 isoform X1 [Triplophysa rosa]